MKTNLIIIFLALLIVILITVLFVIIKKKKEEEYQPLPKNLSRNILQNITPDVLTYEVLPYLTLQDLVYLSRASEDNPEITNTIQKFLRNYLKVDNICDLINMNYFTKFFDLPEFIYSNREEEEDKPKLDIDIISSLALEMIYKAFEIVEPSLLFKNIRPQWVLYNDNFVKGKSILYWGDRTEDFLFRPTTDLSNKKVVIGLSEWSFDYLSHLTVWIRDGEYPEYHKYFREMQQKFTEYQNRYRLPNFIIEEGEEITYMNSLTEDITNIKGGKCYKFWFILNQLKSEEGYSKYIEFINLEKRSKLLEEKEN